MTGETTTLDAVGRLHCRYQLERPGGARSSLDDVPGVLTADPRSGAEGSHSFLNYHSKKQPSWPISAPKCFIRKRSNRQLSETFQCAFVTRGAQESGSTLVVAETEKSPADGKSHRT